MEISSEKSKTMVTGKGIDEQLKIHLNGDELEQVKEFKNPWAAITENANSEPEIRRRVGTASSALA